MVEETRKAMPRVLLVGLDGADWEVVLPLLDAGKLPNLAGLVDRGTIGKCLATSDRTNVGLWTSVATGTTRGAHGVFADPEPTSDGRGLRRAASLSRQRRALWNVLSGVGRRCHAFGWPGSGPAEPVEGVVVTDGFWGLPGEGFGDWALGAGAVYPVRLRKSLGQLRVHPREIGPADLMPLLPKIVDLLKAGDQRGLALVPILARISSIHAAATAVMQMEPWDFAAVWYGGIGEVTRRFGDFHAPAAPWAEVADVEFYGGVVEGMYRFHDLMLGVLIELAGEDTSVVVVSGRGEPAGEARAQPGKTERGDKNYGLFVMAGPGIKRDELLYGTSVLDLVPTVLHTCGVAVGEDLPGKVLIDALEDPGKVETVTSWEEAEGNFGEHPLWKRRDPLTLAVMRKRGVALGMAGAGRDVPEIVSERVEEALVEMGFQRANAMLEAGRKDEAVRLLEVLWEIHPDDSRYGESLVSCCTASGEVERGWALLERILANKKRFAVEAQAEYLVLKRKAEAGGGDGVLTPVERRRMAVLWKRTRSNMHGMGLMRARLLNAARRYEEALAALDAIDGGKVFSPLTMRMLRGELCMHLKRWEEAIEAYLSATEVEPENHDVYMRLALVYIEAGRPLEAVAAARDAVRFRYWSHRTHFLLGAALFRAGDIGGAAAEMEIAVKQNPDSIKAHKRLAWFYSKPLGDEEKGAYHERRFREILAARQRPAPSRVGAGEVEVGLGRKVVDALERARAVVWGGVEAARGAGGEVAGVVLVVGVPGAGMEVMLEALEAAGVGTWSGGVVARKGFWTRDAGGGFCEEEEGMGVDAEAVLEAARAWWGREELRGKAVGVAVPEVRLVPDGVACRVVLMVRPLKTVLKVQGELGCTAEAVKRDYGLGEDVIVDAYQRELLGQLARFEAWREAGVDVGCLPVYYDELVGETGGVMGEVLGWLGVGGGGGDAGRR